VGERALASSWRRLLRGAPRWRLCGDEVVSHRLRERLLQCDVYVVYGAGSERIVFLLVEPTYFGATQVFESYVLCRIEDDASLTPVS
jgi:hypothetical protein